MTPNPEAEQRIRRYLLGELGDRAREEFEQELLTNGELFDELVMLEDELIDEYLGGRMSVAEKQRFESHFLNTPERQEKLKFGRAFNRYLSAEASVISQPSSRSSSRSVGWTQAFFSSPFRFAAYSMLLVAVALGVWALFFRQSDVDKGLLALNAAYREQRPIESRISGLNYAPYSTTRGPGTERVDPNELRRAELTLLDALNKKPTSTVQHALGKVYLAKRQFDDAIKHFDEALRGQPNNAQLYSDLGAAWLEKGRMDLDKEPGRGMEEIGRSQDNLTKAIQLNPNALEALFNRALSRESLTLYPQAEEDWREYLRKDPTSPWAEEARRHLKLLEERKVRTTRDKEQLRQDFLAAYERRDDIAAWAALSRSRARTGNAIVEHLLDGVSKAVTEGRFAEVKESLSKVSYAGKVEFEKVGDLYTSNVASFYGAANTKNLTTLAQGRGLMQSGIKRYEKAEYQQASALFDQARELFRQAGESPETLFAEACTGYCYLRIDAKKASLIFQRLGGIFEQRGYRSLFAQSLAAEADVLSSENEFSKLLEKANQGLAVSEQIEDYANAVRCLQAGTSTQLIFGNYHESLSSTFRALSLVDSLPPNPHIRWPFYHEAAMDFYLLGQPLTAWQFENEALRIATEAKFPLQMSRSYDRLAFLSERSQNYAEAIKYAEQARAEGQRIESEKTRTNILAHSALVFSGLYRASGDHHKAIAAYDQALDLYGRLGLDIYKYRAHKGKLLALMALNDNESAERELAEALYWFEQNREKIAEESYRNKFFDTDQGTYDIAVDFAYTRKSDSAKAFDYAETSRARSLLDLITAGARVSHDQERPQLKISAGTSPLTLSEIQSQMPAQTQLLKYAVLDDKLITWVITRDSHRSTQTLITRAELDRKVENHVDALLRRRERVADTAKELYAVLISPIEAHLKGNLQISIIPSDNLNFVPFAALISPNSGRHLIQDYALAVAPSATIFVRASEQASRKTNVNSERLLVVGNPNFDRERFANLPDLPAATREAEAIASTYGANPLIREEATAARVKQGLKEMEIAHFATHAISDEQSHLLSKLLLAGGGRESHHSAPGYLQASEIYELKLPHTRLVVLSACQTGIERAYRGEGAIGLARPFLTAGVPLVVASLWPVESEATADLMISFHKHRRQDHLSTVEALRRAQLDAIHKQQSGAPRNYEWAAFVAIGGYASY